MLSTLTTTRSDLLKFVKDNVLNVSDLTRSKKLSEILENYAGTQSDEIFIVQNARNRDGQAVIADLEYFEELLTYKEHVDDAIEQIIYQVALERKSDTADVPLNQVISAFDLDVDRILALSETIEEE